MARAQSKRRPIPPRRCRAPGYPRTMTLRIICLCVLACAPVFSRDLRVDPERGDDSGDGVSAPVKTIARAIRLAQPGDTVHLAPRSFSESADLTNKHGEPGKPITLEGHGAVLDGSEPVRGSDWEALDDGLYRKRKLMPRMDDAILGRWFFLWNGTMNHMGRTSKGRSAALKAPAALQPGEWTYVKDEDAFYLRLAPGVALDAANIRYPARSSGVILSGKGAHLVVRDVTSTHVYNDGFNIHGAQRACVFERIAAIECGDDGFSAHEDAECRIDGFVSIGNSTGLCDTVSSVTHYRDVFIRGCLGYDVFFIGDSPHSIENALIESSAQRAFDIEQHTDRPQNGLSSVVLKNVHIRRTGGGPQEIRVGKNGRLTAERCTFLGLDVTVASGGGASFERCVIGGEPKPAVLVRTDAAWRGVGNFYALATLRLANASFTPATLAQAPGESGSAWSADSAVPDGIGADLGAVEKLRPQRGSGRVNQ